MNILIVGVGGQGIMLTSKLLGHAAMLEGMFVRTGETIGMAQRGGSVVSHVRIDSKDTSPFIPIKAADLLLGFEPCETIRHFNRLSDNGACVANTKAVVPETKKDEYRLDEFLNFLSSRKCSLVDASSLAVQAGNAKALNITILGAAHGMGLLPIKKESLLKAIEDNVPQKFLEQNINAFILGAETGGRINGVL